LPRVFHWLIVLILMASAVSFARPANAQVATISIPITIKGLSPRLSVTVLIDGQSKGTIAGGSTKTYTVERSKPHTFEVDAMIKGNYAKYEGTDVRTRYSNVNNFWTLDVISTQNCQQAPVCYDYYWYCDAWGNCWYEPYCTYEQQCWSISELAEKGHTFAYSVEQEVVVNDIHGQNTDTWQSVDSNVNLSAVESVILIDNATAKARDVFVRWVVNGAPVQGKSVSLKADKPLYIKAEYQTVAEYRLTVNVVPPEVGNITLDPPSPDHWYRAGTSIQATAIATSLSCPFDHWELDGTSVSRISSYTITMNSADSVTAVFCVATKETLASTTTSSDTARGVTVTALTGTGTITSLTTEMTASTYQPSGSPSLLLAASILMAVVSVALLVAFAISEFRRAHAIPASPRICSNCGFGNPPYARAFCVKCGEPLER